MRISHWNVLLVASLLLTALLPISAAVSAPDAKQTFWDAQGCTRPDANGRVDVLAPPGAAFIGWMSPCVIIPNGGSVTWMQGDLIGHGAASDATCFDLGTMTVLGGTPASAGRSSTSLTFSFDTSEGIAYTLSNANALGTCDSFAQTATEIVIPYHCIIHGALMPGKIIVEL